MVGAGVWGGRMGWHGGAVDLSILGKFDADPQGGWEAWVGWRRGWGRGGKRRVGKGGVGGQEGGGGSAARLSFLGKFGVIMAGPPWWVGVGVRIGVGNGDGSYGNCWYAVNAAAVDSSLWVGSGAGLGSGKAEGKGTHSGLGLGARQMSRG